MNTPNPILDLYKDHGILSRVLLIYEKWISLFDKDVSPSIMFRAASIVRLSAEKHHERLEEKFIFPLLAGTELDQLTKTLIRQHADGWKMTDIIIQNISNPYVPWRVITAAKEFITMYQRHKALEDTLIFPAVVDKLSDDSMAELGEIFESLEEEEDTTLQKIETLEKKLDIS